MESRNIFSRKNWGKGKTFKKKFEDREKTLKEKILRIKLKKFQKKTFCIKNLRKNCMKKV